MDTSDVEASSDEVSVVAAGGRRGGGNEGGGRRGGADHAQRRGTGQAKNWCFTVNNPEEHDELDGLPEGSVYVIFGRENAGTGTAHLQGFISYDSPKRFTQVSRLFGGRAHWEVARNVPASIQYCKKEGDFTEFGVPPSAGGKRKELDLFKAAVRSGNRDHKALREEFSNVYCRYHRFAHQYVFDHAPEVELELHPLRGWQASLYRILSRSPEPRKIYFVVDLDGSAGKSWFAEYVESKKENVQVIGPGKKADMAYCLHDTTRILIVDCPRCKSEHLQYDFLEECKNGRVFNPKYESKMMRMPRMHVVVMMNERPDEKKLSRDRYVIWRTKEDGNYDVENV